MLKFILFIMIFFTNSLAFEILKLGTYKGQDISGWLASEKLDGVRAYWNTKELLTRQGKKIQASNELLAILPPFDIDGELWIARNSFERTQSAVMDATPDTKAWSEVSYNIFDAPTQKGGLLDRLEVVQKYIDTLDEKSKSKLKVIPQHKINTKQELDKMLDEITKAGGEGVVIREPNHAYKWGKSELDLKYKRFIDAECQVVSINKGKGKIEGLLGSITCETKDGKRFKIGSGFNDETRSNPPKIGDTVTYKYLNLTAKGVPRFAVFMRVRKD